MAESEKPKVRTSDNCFDFIRLIAAVSVVIAHGVRHFEAPWLFIPSGTNVLHEGVEGVRVFFILSGMLVFQSGLRCIQTGRPLKSFFANRFLRVAPAIYMYALVATLVLLILGAITVSQVASKGYLLWFAGNFLLYPLYFPEAHRSIGVGVLNGSLWTIPVEVTFYLCVPFLAWLWVKGKEKLMWVLTSLAVIGATALHWWTFNVHPEWFEKGAKEPLWFKVFVASLPPWLFWFALGVMFYKYWERMPKSFGLFLASLVSYLLLSFVFFDALQPLGPARHLLYGLPLGYATVWFGYNGPAKLRDLSKLGDLSYGVYVWHMVIINIMLYLGLKDTIPKSLIVTVTLVATLFVAWLSWWLIEKPSLARKPYTSRS